MSVIPQLLNIDRRGLDATIGMSKYNSVRHWTHTCGPSGQGFEVSRPFGATWPSLVAIFIAATENETCESPLSHPTLPTS